MDKGLGEESMIGDGTEDSVDGDIMTEGKRLVIDFSSDVESKNEDVEVDFLHKICERGSETPKYNVSETKPTQGKPVTVNEAALATLGSKLREFAAKVSSEKFKSQNGSKSKKEESGTSSLATPENVQDETNEGAELKVQAPTASVLSDKGTVVEDEPQPVTLATEGISDGEKQDSVAPTSEASGLKTYSEESLDESAAREPIEKESQQKPLNDSLVNEESTASLSDNVLSETGTSNAESTEIPASCVSDNTCNPEQQEQAETENGSSPMKARQKLSLSTDETVKPNAVPTSPLPRTPADERKLTLDWHSVGVHRCQVCKFSTDQEDIFKNHTTTCTPPRQPDVEGPIHLLYNGTYFCETCHISWKIKAEFEEHLVCHLYEEPYVCITCKKTFSSRSSIEFHAKNDHPKGESRCGLRGVKKGRKVIEELEVKKKYKVFGRLMISKTPRNQVKEPVAGMSPQATVTSPAQLAAPGTVVGSPQATTSMQGTVGLVSQNETATASPTASVSSVYFPPNTAATQSSFIATSSVLGSVSTSSPLSRDTATCDTQTRDSPLLTSGMIHAAKKVSKASPDLKLKFSQYMPPKPIQTVSPQICVTQPITTTSQPILLIPMQAGNQVLIPLPYQQPSQAPVMVPNQMIANNSLMIPGPVQMNKAVTDVNSTVHHKPPVGTVIPQGATSVSYIRNPSFTATSIQNPMVVGSTRQVIAPPNVTVKAVPTNVAVPVMNVSTAVSTVAVPPLPSLPVGPLPAKTSIVASLLESCVQSKVLPTVQGTQVNKVNAVGVSAGNPSMGNPPSYAEAIQKKLAGQKDSALPTEKVSADAEADKGLSKKFLFRIKPGSGFVCEACRKFTQDEVMFRKHVWDHFHQVGSLACKTCSDKKLQERDFMKCQLVNDIICSLVKRSISESIRQKDLRSSGATPDKAITVGEDESITISDDEDKEKDHPSQEEKKKGNGTAVIVIDEEAKLENDGNSDLQIKISSTYSLQDSFEKGAFEAMQSDDAQPATVGPGVKTSEETSGNLDSNIAKDSSKEGNDVQKEAELANTLKESSGIQPVSTADAVSSIAKNLMTPTEEKEKEKEQKNEKQSSPVLEQATVKSLKAGSRSRTASPVGANDVFQKLEDHIQKDSPRGSFYMCSFTQCSFSTTVSPKYREHLATHHAGAYNYVCCHCGLKSLSDDSHVRHMTSHTSLKSFVLYSCPFGSCKFKTNLLNAYKTHVLHHQHFKCCYCFKVFPGADSLIAHLRENLLQFINCPSCTFKHTKRLHVLNHIYLMHPDKPRIVTVTGQVICKERELNFYCPPLDKALQDGHSRMDVSDEEDAVDDHMLDVETHFDDNFSSQESAAEDLLAVPNSERRTGIRSLPVGSSVGKGSELTDHDDSVINPPKIELQRSSPKGQKKKEKVVDSPKSLLCTVCQYLSWNQALFMAHSKLHDQEPEREKRFVCMMCPKGIDIITKFKKHVANHVGKHNLVIFQCTLCAYNTNQKYHIMDHVRDNHFGAGTFFQKTETIKSNEFSCKSCDYKSRQSEHVSLHEQAVHSQQAQSNKASKVTPVVSPARGVQAQAAEVSKKSMKYHCQYCNGLFKHKYILRTHMEVNHKDIENKTFVTYKCKYCYYTSTKKETIISHMGRKHEGAEVRILRRIENVDSSSDKVTTGETSDFGSGSSHSAEQVSIPNQPSIESHHCDFCEYSTNTQPKLNAHVSLHHTPGKAMAETCERDSQGPKEEVQIPDGNIYKFPFQCPKCPFSNRIRINVMRHIKRHPELVPVRAVQPATSDPKKVSTARKSTTTKKPQATSPTSKSSVLSFQGTSPSRALKNSFAAAKEKVLQLEEEADEQNLTEEKQYHLDDDSLHSKLSACFIPLSKDTGYKCRICQQNIAKKFVLHRHILEHLKIVFYKCSYCEEGTLEQSLIQGHIHKEHPLKQVNFKTIRSSEIDEQLKNKILNQNFNDSVDIFEAADRVSVTNAALLENGIVKQKILESEKVKQVPANEVRSETDAKGELQCHLCNYVGVTSFHLRAHLETHESGVEKRFGCSVCGYRSNFKNDVVRHLTTRHPGKPCKVVPLRGETQKEPERSTKSAEKQSREERDRRSESAESAVSVKTTSSGSSSCQIIDDKNLNKDSSGDFVKNAKGKKIKTDQIKVSSAGVFEMRAIYKCKDCGERRSSKGGIYDHFRNTVCSRPWYQCNYCCVFVSPAKSAITKHSRIRHVGKKVAFSELPMSSKIKVIKIPVRQSELTFENVDDGDRTGPKSPEEATKQQSQMSSPTEGGDAKRPHVRYLHKCKICMKYKSESLLRLQFHINTKHGGKVIYCLECNYKTPLVKHMINHCTNIHGQKSARYSQGDEESHFKLQRQLSGKSTTETTPKENKQKQEMKSSQSPASKPASAKQASGSKPLANEYKKEETPVKCPKCNYVAEKFIALRRHLGGHFNYKPYVCKYCSAKLQYEANLKRHVQNVHAGKELKYSVRKDDAIEAKIERLLKQTKRRIEQGKEKSKSDIVREQLMAEEEALGIGRLKAGGFFCKICKYEHDKRFQLRYHMARQHGKGKKISGKRSLEGEDDVRPKKVPKVEKQADDSDSAEDDIEDAAEGSGDESETGEPSPLKFRVARDSDTGERLYQCMNCDYKTKKKKNLQGHMVSHGSKNYKCWYCNYSSKLICNAYRHIENVHKGKNLRVVNLKRKQLMSPKREKVSGPEKNSSPNVPVKKSILKTAAAASAISNIEKQSHRMQRKMESVKPAAVLSYCCNVCDFKVMGLYHFRQHLATHTEFSYLTKGTEIESRLSCGYCSYMAVDDIDFSSHISSHLDERPYKCSYCDFSDYSKARVKFHLGSTHPDEEEVVVNLKLGTHDVRSASQVMLVNCDPVVVLEQVEVSQYETGRQNTDTMGGDDGSCVEPYSGEKQKDAALEPDAVQEAVGDKSDIEIPQETDKLCADTPIDSQDAEERPVKLCDAAEEIKSVVTGPSEPADDCVAAEQSKLAEPDKSKEDLGPESGTIMDSINHSANGDDSENDEVENLNTDMTRERLEERESDTEKDGEISRECLGSAGDDSENDEVGNVNTDMMRERSEERESGAEKDGEISRECLGSAKDHAEHAEEKDESHLEPNSVEQPTEPDAEKEMEMDLDSSMNSGNFKEDNLDDSLPHEPDPVSAVSLDKVETDTAEKSEEDNVLAGTDQPKCSEEAMEVDN